MDLLRSSYVAVQVLFIFGNFWEYFDRFLSGKASNCLLKRDPVTWVFINLFSLLYVVNPSFQIDRLLPKPDISFSMCMLRQTRLALLAS